MYAARSAGSILSGVNLSLSLDHEVGSYAPSALPDATADLRLMLDLIPGRGGGDVTDPYYGKDDGFAATWDDVAAVAAALVAEFSPKG